MGFDHRSAPLLRALAVCLALAASSSAVAALGGDAASIEADRVAFAAQLRSTATLQYDVHEMVSGARTVREYLSRQGQVFAVTWQGVVPPDMRQLLGGYFPRLQSAAMAAQQQRPGQHRLFTLARSDLVIQSAGRLRNFHGIAYAPALVPASVNVNQLQ